MFSVEELIGNLLLRHNCVIIPSFGGFVAKQSSATIDYKNGVMLPPRKSVLFNRQLVNNDGLLIAEFAHVNQIIYPKAENIVADKVVDWNEKLRNGERITLDRVGYLFYDQEKNICFEQDRFFNLLLESYGLGKVHFVSEEDIKISNQFNSIQEQIVVNQTNNEEPTFKLVDMPIIEEAPIVVSENDFVIIEHPATKSTSKLWKYVAAAILLPIGFYSFWLPLKTNVLESGVLSIKDFNPTYKASEGLYEPKALAKIKLEKEDITLEESLENVDSQTSIYSYALDENTFLNVKISDKKGFSEQPQEKQTVSVEEVQKEEVKKTAEKEVKAIKEVTAAKSPSTQDIIKYQTTNSVKNFDFIIGSFKTEEAANMLISKLKSQGLAAYMLKDSAGNNRVSAGSASTAEEIKLIADKSKASGVEGWILKK